MTPPERNPRMPPPRSESPTYLVRHGAMRCLGEFGLAPGLPVPARHASVVVTTERGTEIGEVLAPASPHALAALPDPTRGTIIRYPTAEDRASLAKFEATRSATCDRCAQLIREHALDMQVVDVEFLLGGERFILYFLAENRVDFRELVKAMAREFRTRIELRQIGLREEAKLLADYGDCGRPVCCNTHLAVLPPVSMRMAKLQKATLDPNKISGRCGRLKCCLRYEQDVYEEFAQELPPVGARVVTKTGPGRVLAQETLARRLLVEFEDGRRLPVPAADVLSRI
jgi:cell fate regulator YaaT (PSP1 superfamily)